MPLHLLGKKSWNVYNADNVARVRRDEAEAKAREEEEERRMQEVDADRRMRLLKGLDPESPPPAPTGDDDERKSGAGQPGHTRERKRRRIAGENDTDHDIRWAKEASESRPPAQAVLDKPIPRKKISDAPLTDHAGHINLFPDDRSTSHVVKNREAEAEAAKKKREFEDQYTMRFSNAAGLKQNILDNPWYSTNGSGATSAEPESKDVWGNEDPRRKEREDMRRLDNDPLASMRRGVKRLKEVEKARTAWDMERQLELAVLKATQERKSRRRRADSVEDFSLDRLADHSEDSRPKERSSRPGHHHRHRHHRDRDRRQRREPRSKSPSTSSHRLQDARCGEGRGPSDRLHHASPSELSKH
ncbi:MAG: hypothetical protein M1825_002508 [Sarcosagium campestre]|nr:MAG: hypothetical protein M1825_002508 [Sarcosagium campestre]